MTISLAVILIPFGLFYLFFVLYSIFTIYHLLRFGVYNFHLYLICFVYIAGAILLSMVAAELLINYNWTAPLRLNPPFETGRINPFEL